MLCDCFLLYAWMPAQPLDHGPLRCLQKGTFLFQFKYLQIIFKLIFLLFSAIIIRQRTVTRDHPPLPSKNVADLLKKKLFILFVKETCTQNYIDQLNNCHYYLIIWLLHLKKAALIRNKKNLLSQSKMLITLHFQPVQKWILSKIEESTKLKVL